VKLYIFSINVWSPISGKTERYAVVGPAAIATVEAALAHSPCSPGMKDAIRTCTVVRNFVEGACKLGGVGGYGRYHSDDSEPGWSICIGIVDEILP
jgi:predicted urease superfamily metal-dependent hydrolase